MTALHCDVAFIGAGSGLEIVSQAVSHGLSVAVIEEGPFGGTCLNRGCIPSKMLIHSADVALTIAGASQFGINARIEGVDWNKIIERASVGIDQDARNIEEALERAPNVTVFSGSGRFRAPGELQVGDDVVHAGQFVIAAGGRPHVPEIRGLDSVPYMTSDQALRLPAQPKSLLIVGGGFIAAELAHFFGALGTDVTLVVRAARLLRHEDDEVSERFTSIFSRRFRVLLDSNVIELGPEGDQIRARVRTGEEITDVLTDSLLFATSRVPNTDLLEVANAGVELDDRGYVKTDEYLQTNVPGTWALGDIVGRYELKHSANLEASYVAHNLLNPEDRLPVDYSAMPHAIFSSPQVASVGETERELREQNRPYLVSTYPYDQAAFGANIEDHDGFFKVLADPETREILGCHVLGTHASILIQEAINAMHARSGVAGITGSIYIHPAMPEIVQRAFGSLSEPHHHHA